jgi:hypothetical protein
MANLLWLFLNVIIQECKIRSDQIRSDQEKAIANLPYVMEVGSR